MKPAPALRVRTLVDAPPREQADHVLYWMTAARRTRFSHALDHAVHRALELDLPLLVLEGLRVDHAYASDRLHRFVLDGMRDNAAACARAGVAYHPYVEPEAGAGKGLLEALAERAAVVVTDDYPAYFLPRMLEAASRRLETRLEAVDGNGLLPMRAAERDFATAYAFRRFLQKTLPEHLEHAPRAEPLRSLSGRPRARVPREVLQRWPAAGVALLEGRPGALDALPIDHAVAPVAQAGGEAAALGRLRAWLRDGLARYVDERNQPLSGATSELSPYLHFGHVSAWEVFSAVAKAEGWTLDRLSPRADGRRSGWWGMGASAEAFVDQLVTWRELGFNFCAFRDDAAELDSLPDFARETLARHAGDAREHVYRLPAFERAETHDEIWNAAQRELLREGRIHNYLRMLWGKKILEWTRSPREALSVLLTLNDRFALDGRDPNSLSGIFWCLGRYDRGWGPEREVFGTVRYMSSANTARKVRLGAYLARYAP